ncbi:MAG: rRNA pseudouridine synthase [Pedobacter sp.]|nr:rRNA pseudouridine synthase [Chitinophagaceae bacterium]
MHRYFVINKPYKMVSQFISSHKVRLLGDMDFDFPEGTHAIGRLDNHSEGLLLLTTNKRVTKLLFESDMQHKRTYLVKVRGIVTPADLQQLQTGINIIIKGGKDYITTPCEGQIVEPPTDLFKGGANQREGLPTTWLTITLTEGKYHQVRKMVAAINHQCQRLIRLSIENLELGSLQAGEVKEVEEAYFFKQLNIDNWKEENEII